MKIELWPNRKFPDQGSANINCSTLTPYLLEGEGPFPAVIVCPGGGYAFRAEHEGEPVAKWLNRIGLSAVVLNYRVAPYRYPSSFEDARRAIRLLRSRAKEWHIDSNRVGMLGFSAGGHLAGTVGVHSDWGNGSAEDPIEKESCHPDFMILGYPLISIEKAMDEIKQNLLGKASDPVLQNFLSIEKQVIENTPPAFMWQTADDDIVPVEHLYHLANVLSENKVPYEMHVFEKGVHGLGLAEWHQEARIWTFLCENWMKARRIIRSHPRFTEYSTVGELLQDEQACNVLEEHMPHALEKDEQKWMKGFTLKHLAAIPESRVTEEILGTMVKELYAIKE